MLVQLDLGNYAWALGKAFAELATKDGDFTEDDRETTIIRYVCNSHPARLSVRAAPCCALSVTPVPSCAASVQVFVTHISCSCA